jgi:hypothetical protein
MDRTPDYESGDRGSSPRAVTIEEHQLRWKMIKRGRSAVWQAYSLGPEQTRLVYGAPEWRMPKTKEKG